MSPPPTSIDGTDITGATIDGQDVQEITVDGDTVFTAIPDRGDLHARFDATELSLNDGDPVSLFPDETGNGHDLTAGNAPTFKTSIINGNPAVRFDGVNDFLDVAFAELSQPNHIFGVFQFQSISGLTQDFYDGNDGSGRNEFIDREGDFSIFAGSAIVRGSPSDTNPHISSALYNGASSVLRIDGANDASGNPGSEGLNGFSVGANFQNGNHGEIDVGEILIYPQDKSGIQTDVEQLLSDKWGITV